MTLRVALACCRVMYCTIVMFRHCRHFRTATRDGSSRTLVEPQLSWLRPARSVAVND
jgi:hypothetical protein